MESIRFIFRDILDSSICILARTTTFQSQVCRVKDLISRMLIMYQKGWVVETRPSNFNTYLIIPKVSIKSYESLTVFFFSDSIGVRVTRNDLLFMGRVLLTIHICTRIYFAYKEHAGLSCFKIQGRP